MATHLEQHLVLEDAPEWMRKATARYKGTKPELQNWLGHDLTMTEVEAAIPAGERDMVMVHDPEGNEVYPWRHVPVVERDELGAIVSHGW